MEVELLWRQQLEAQLRGELAGVRSELEVTKEELVHTSQALVETLEAKERLERDDELRNRIMATDISGLHMTEWKCS